MASRAKSIRTSKSIQNNEINLVSARAEANRELRKLSRNRASDAYAQIRKKRVRKKRILTISIVVVASLVIASLVGVAAFALIINSKLGTDFQGNKTDFNSGVYEGILEEPPIPEDPFYMLLLGTDERPEDEGYARADTIILVRVDPNNKQVAMISIPRDTLVTIPGVGQDKINAAYFYGMLAHDDYVAGYADEDSSGPALMIRTVENFAGVDISYFAQVNFDRFAQLVDDVGGVEVDVPVDIVGDYHVGYVDVYAGQQTLDGEHALAFVRSRNFANGDYQRQANQRTFLQALAQKVLNADIATIITTVNNIANMTYTNMSADEIVNYAKLLRGMKANDIHTYTVPSYTETRNEISYVIADTYSWNQLITAVKDGEYPELQDSSLAGVMPDSYAPGYANTTDATGGAGTGIDTSQYLVDVRNGYGIAGSATSVSDMLALAGYQQGEIGNTNSFVYEETLIIYRDEEDLAAAEDIKARIGYGRVIPSEGYYVFEGDVLVVVGGDFKG
ncbi:MAG: LCP family protein [Coriobacteriales bacterium]|jgi:LCP family protein required for cell wall assembly|nr:LCP family protein [Coriobacteriales bacterium]